MDADAGAALASVKIVTTLPAVGTLALAGTAVTLNEVVTKAQIDDGDLTFTPVDGASGTGYATFTFKVNDGTVDSASAYTMTIDARDLTCAAPDFAGDNRRELWTGIVTVGDVGPWVTDSVPRNPRPSWTTPRLPSAGTAIRSMPLSSYRSALPAD